MEMNVDSAGGPTRPIRTWYCLLWSYWFRYGLSSSFECAGGSFPMGDELSCGEMITVSLRLAALCHVRCGVGGVLPPLCCVLLPALLVRRPVP